MTTRDEAVARLNTYREHRTSLHDDVVEASAAGLTQAEIARESGLSRQYVANLLRNASRQER